MSQVDDWSDGYTSDYLRDLNTYGPASANVPRSSVVSHQVRYRAPVTSDIPLAPGQNPEDSVYSNASGARMGQTKPASGYRAPAGGGWDVNSSDTNLRFSNESGGKQYRVSRTQTAKKTVKKKTKSASKQQPQPEYRTGGSRTPEENEITRSAAEHRVDADLGQLNSQALDAAARFLPALKLLLGFGAGAGSADTSSTDRPSYMGAVGTMADNFARTLPQPSAASRQTDPESSSIEGQFKNMPWYEDAKAHHEAVKKNMDDYGSALGTLKSTWDDIPWWTKLVMLPPVFKAGSPAAGASTTGNVWAEGSRAAAGDATAGAKAFEESLSRMNGGAVRGAPVEGAARRSFSSAGTATGQSAGNRSFGFDLSPEQVARAKSTHSAYVNGEAAGSAAPRAADYGKSSFDFNLSPAEAMSARTQHSAFVSNLAELHSSLIRSGMPEREVAAYMQRAGFYNNPEALQQAVFTIRKHGPSGLFERSADEAAAAGIYNPSYGKSPLEIWQRERAATEAANAKFRDMFGFSDVGKLAEAGNVGRGTAAMTEQTTSNLVQQLRAAGIPEDQIAASIARINAGAAGREAAAAGEAAAGSRSFRFDLSPEEAARARASHEAFVREAAAGRGSAGNGAAADGGVSELANAGNAGRGTVALTEQTARQGLGEVRAAAKSSNITYEEVMQSVADFAAGKPGTNTAIDIAQSYAQLYRSGFGSMLSPRELKVAKAYEHATEPRIKGNFTDSMSQFIDGVLSGVPK